MLRGRAAVNIRSLTIPDCRATCRTFQIHISAIFFETGDSQHLRFEIFTADEYTYTVCAAAQLAAIRARTQGFWTGTLRMITAKARYPSSVADEAINSTHIEQSHTTFAFQEQ